jgi:hypothetical protein
MSPRRVVVDGSNIATEGRSTPSLAQLDEAIREFQREHPDAEITVVVDASFGHRIDESERPLFEEAMSKGEIVSPPAGAIGRGDAFLLRIAERTGAMVLSNDSFQEFHGEHDWLFTKGRLIGGKPVPGVGWIFTPRTPVRGPRSREAVSEAKRTRVRIGSKEASQPMPVPKVPPPGPVVVRDASGAERASGLEAARVDDAVREAIEAATEEVVAPESTSARRRRRRRSSGAPPQAVNDPLTFITFIADHPLGSELEGEVESFTSHGAFVLVDGTRCYIPLSGMGDPPPRRARQVLSKGERRRFVLQALDPQRRGVELALPGFARVAGAPSAETVKAEIAGTSPRTAPEARRRSRRRRRSKRTGATGATGVPGTPGGEGAEAFGSTVEAPVPTTGATLAAVPAGAPRAGATRSGHAAGGPAPGESELAASEEKAGAAPAAAAKAIKARATKATKATKAKATRTKATRTKGAAGDVEAAAMAAIAVPAPAKAATEAAAAAAPTKVPTKAPSEPASPAAASAARPKSAKGAPLTEPVPETKARKAAKAGAETTPAAAGAEPPGEAKATTAAKATKATKTAAPAKAAKAAKATKATTKRTTAASKSAAAATKASTEAGPAKTAGPAKAAKATKATKTAARAKAAEAAKATEAAAKTRKARAPNASDAAAAGGATTEAGATRRAATPATREMAGQ